MKSKGSRYLIIILLCFILIGIISSASFAYFRDLKTKGIPDLLIEYNVTN